MLTVPANTGTPVKIFEAVADGVHALLAIGTGGTYRLNSPSGQEMSVESNGFGQVAFAPIFLESGDSVYFSGPNSIQLVGCRLTDEVPSE